MTEPTTIASDLMIIVLLFAGIYQFRFPRAARFGNLTAAVALGCAAGLVLYRNGVEDPAIVAAAVAAGSAAGWIVAAKVTMIQIPAMVAFQHGAGGVAALLISYIELTRAGAAVSSVGQVSGLLGMAIGAATFSGSMVAGGKLANKIKQTPVVFPAHNLMLAGLALAVAGAGFGVHYTTDPPAPFAVAMIALSIAFGIVFAVRIGGADMPVLISFLNAAAGLAAAFCGVIMQNRLLVVCGATVAASGSILTQVMCRAMNRSLGNIFIGIRNQAAAAQSATPAPPPKAPAEQGNREDAMAGAIGALAEAKSVIIIPGYGMALAQAQQKVKELYDLLERRGAEVKFAIHPVAGRMPGHMNVLLAEVDIPYDHLCEMEAINPEFSAADAVLVVGACDVVNPAAITAEGTPIYGMPILRADEARTVIVCNLDTRPGYSGVENTLYSRPNVNFLAGNAAETIARIIEGLRQ
ncbi:MAG: NAD(P)(+) transhydrogenase (Re/Si-specific) subunit beta [Spirochaetes bacterium]|nr:NAD(P)(+) transhydrogenase (Re/Si-specific) subunit beta [Spirochaetota bacterium]